MNNMTPLKFSLATLASATSLLALATPAQAQDECGVAPPAGGTVTCTTAGNDYPNGIFYIAPADLTIVLEDGVVVDTSGGLNAGVLAISGTDDAAISVLGATNTSITTDASGGFGALVATTNGDLTVRLDEISTTGANASGILASSSEGLVTVSANNISTTGDSADGIDAGTDLGDIFIDAGTITTAGLGANGISANSDFADINIVADSITTTGGPSGFINPGANGILATTGGLGTITIDAGTISTSGQGAIGIRASNFDGAVQIDADSVTTSGPSADGISVRSNAAVDVDAGIVATSGVGSNGIQVQSRDSATIAFDTVTTTGDNSVGILVPQGALFFGPLFTPDVTITGGSVSTAGLNSDAIRAIASTGMVDIALDGDISTEGDNSRGIFATGPTGVTISGDANVSTTGVASNAVDVTSTAGPVDISLGTVSATGLGSIGVNALTTSGAQTIMVDGVIADGAAIQAISTDGTQSIAVNGEVDSATSAGIISTTAGDRTITIGADGSVDGATSAIQFGGTGTATIANAGTIGTLPTGLALDAATAGALTLNNNTTGTVNGRLLFGAANDTFANQGVFNTQGTTDFGAGLDTFTNTGTTNLTGDATLANLEEFNLGGNLNLDTFTLTGSGDLDVLADATVDTNGSAGLIGFTALNNAGTIDLAAGTFTAPAGLFTNSGTILADEGAATITGQTSFANSGTVDLQDGVPNDVLTIDSDFAGSGDSTLSIDFDGSESDLLVINGAASGSTSVDANFLGGPLINLGGALVVDAETSTDDAFVLGTVAGDSPLVSFDLVQDGADFLLVSAPTAAAFEPLAVPGFAADIWYQSADEVFAETVKPATTVGASFWGNGYISRNTYGDRDGSVTIQGENFDVDNRLKTKRYGVQLGADYGFGGGRIGLTGGYGSAKTRSGNDLKADGWNVGVYGQFGGLTGFHGEFLAKHDRYKGEFNGGAFDGEKFDIRANGIDGSIGYRMGMGETATVDVHAGVSRVRTKVDDVSAFGFDYDIATVRSTRGRAGVRAIFGGGMAPYVDATAYREFDGDSDVELFDGGGRYNLDTNGKATWLRIEGGLSGNNGPGPILAVWGDVGDRKGLGLRAGWRFGGARVAEVAPPPPYVAPPAPAPAPATQTCADGSLILATDMCPPAPEPYTPPPPPAPMPERG